MGDIKGKINVPGGQIYMVETYWSAGHMKQFPVFVPTAKEAQNPTNDVIEEVKEYLQGIVELGTPNKGVRNPIVSFAAKILHKLKQRKKCPLCGDEIGNHTAGESGKPECSASNNKS